MGPVVEVGAKGSQDMGTALEPSESRNASSLPVPGKRQFQPRSLQIPFFYEVVIRV